MQPRLAVMEVPVRTGDMPPPRAAPSLESDTPCIAAPSKLRQGFPCTQASRPCLLIPTPARTILQTHARQDATLHIGLLTDQRAASSGCQAQHSLGGHADTDLVRYHLVLVGHISLVAVPTRQRSQRSRRARRQPGLSHSGSAVLLPCSTRHVFRPSPQDLYFVPERHCGLCRGHVACRTARRQAA